MTAYIVDFTFYAFANYQVDSFAVVFHIQPVAHIATVTINRKLLAFQNILDNQRNQLFGEMIRTVVIGAAGNGYRHLIRIMISHNHHIGTCFGSTVRTVRTKRSLLCEVSFGTQ